MSQILYLLLVVVAHFSKLCLILCNPMDCGTLSFIISHTLLKLMSIKSMMPSNSLILCHPLLLLPSIFPTIRVFSKELALHIGWPKYWRFSFSISPSTEYSGLISIRIDWFDLLAVQGTLNSLLLYHNWKASILWHLAFFMVQLSHLHTTPGKTIPLTIWTFVSKGVLLLFNILSRFAIPLLPQSKCLIIVAAVTVHSDFGPHENKICHCFHFFPIYLL